MIALEVKNVKKYYKARRNTVIKAVDDVTFEVQSGEIFGLLGMNGAGKSTTIKMCTGLAEPDCGSVCVYGCDIVKEREKAKTFLNVSPQETAVASALTVKENLMLIAQIYGADKISAKQRAEEIMKQLKLEDRANDSAGKLSGGLMRRLSIGMALITSPKLVFLDEPTLGLDVVARRELWRYIEELKGSAAVVITTHYLEEAEKLCDRIAIMKGGKISAVGTPEELVLLSGKGSFEDAFLTLSGEEVSV